MAEFVMAFITLSLGLVVTISFIMGGVGREVNYYTRYVNEHARYVWQELPQSTPRYECEDNPLWYVRGGEPCQQ